GRSAMTYASWPGCSDWVRHRRPRGRNSRPIRTLRRSVARWRGRRRVAVDCLAADRRSALTSAGLARARSAGVVAMAPLGLCFLPAFVCLGIVPIVLSLFGDVLPA